jgi:hypothetical protein
MTAAEREIYSLLKQHGAILERDRKHRVYRFPDGRTFTLPSTCSDVRGYKNGLAMLRRFLGVSREIVKNPNRREKIPPAPQRYIADGKVDLPDWKHQLQQIREGSGDNMIEKIYRCDGANCKQQRGPANGWLIFKLTDKPIFEVRAWDDRLANRKEYGHLCSDSCAIKKMVAVVRGAHNHTHAAPIDALEEIEAQ